MKKMIGYTPTMGLHRDEACKRRYLNATITYGLQDPELEDCKEFVPAGALLLDFLAVYQENMARTEYVGNNNWTLPCERSCHYEL